MNTTQKHMYTPHDTLTAVPVIVRTIRLQLFFGTLTNVYSCIMSVINRKVDAITVRGRLNSDFHLQRQLVLYKFSR